MNYRYQFGYPQVQNSPYLHGYNTYTQSNNALQNNMGINEVISGSIVDLEDVVIRYIRNRYRCNDFNNT